MNQKRGRDSDAKRGRGSDAYGRRRRASKLPSDGIAKRSGARSIDIPPREDIIEALRRHGVPMRPEELAASLGVVSAEERDAFQARLAAMERDGQLMTNRKGALCVAAKLDILTGTVQGHPDGFGFLVSDEAGPDIFLSPAEMRKVLHGDRVTVRTIGLDRRGRPEGAIVDVLAR
ncbi:MAG TPA: hypothetical protein VKE42_11120, partial [Candidatus Cybelea sp.]|nr:hypothetical protein [Candidatus Cybelea sp.]